MNTCPKCGSPQASELTTSGFTLQKKAMWFGCGSHVLLDEPEKILSRTNQCRDHEEINDLRRKVEEDADRIRELEEQIKVKEFLLNEAMKDLETEQADHARSQYLSRSAVVRRLIIEELERRKAALLSTEPEVVA